MLRERLLEYRRAYDSMPSSGQIQLRSWRVMPRLHQDVKVFDPRLTAGEAISYALDLDRHAWIQVIEGSITVNGTALRTGDGAGIEEENGLSIKAIEDAQVLLFDLS